MKKTFLLLIINLIPFTRFYPFKAFLLKASGAKLGENVRIAGKIHVSNSGNLIVGNNVWLGDGIKIYNSGFGKVIFKNNIDVAPNCLFVTGSHKIGDTSHRAGEGVNTPIILNNGVWLGASCTILGGANVGEGTVVAAGAVVNKELLSNHIYGGIPAKIIKPLEP